MKRMAVNVAERWEGGEVDEGGVEHQAVVLICKFSQMTQRL